MAAQRLRQGKLGLMAATQAGLFPPLGEGIVPIARAIETLIDRGYAGWYVLEQDVAITDGAPPVGGARRSASHAASSTSAHSRSLGLARQAQ